MKTAQDYPVRTPYGYTGAPYSPQQPHRGNDRKMAIGTPIVIANTVIAYSGNSGTFKGQTYEPHLHTQAGTDSACQKTVKPDPYEFQPGVVVAVGTGPQWGKYVTMKVGEHFITYAHLSEIKVSVGQKISANKPLSKEESMATPPVNEGDAKNVFRALGYEPNPNDIAAAVMRKDWKEWIYQDVLTHSAVQARVAATDPKLAALAKAFKEYVKE